MRLTLGDGSVLAHQGSSCENTNYETFNASADNLIIGFDDMQTSGRGPGDIVSSEGLPDPCPSDDEGWYYGDEGLSCTDVCAAHSLECSEEELWAHNDDVDSAAGVAALASALAGYTITCPNGDADWYGSSYAPIVAESESKCYFSWPGRDLSTFTCSAEPTHTYKRRLCYCSQSGDCTDTDNGATDSYGDGCDFYYVSLLFDDDYISTAMCDGGVYDDDDFTANDMCCGCDDSTEWWDMLDDDVVVDDDYFEFMIRIARRRV